MQTLPRSAVAIVFTLLAASSAPGPASGSAFYRVTDLRANGYHRHFITGMNERGQLIGFSGTWRGPQAFLYDSQTGALEDWGRDLFDGQTSRPLDINHRGQALVSFGDAYRPSYAIVDQGRVTWSSRPEPETIYTSIGADGIPRGYEQGYDDYFSGMRAHSVVVGEQRTPLPALPSDSGRPTINEVDDSGLVVGNYLSGAWPGTTLRPFLLKDGELIDAGTPGADSSNAVAVNAHGEVAISETEFIPPDDGWSRMIVIDRDGNRQAFGDAGLSVVPEAINGSGHVVGTMVSTVGEASSWTTQAFLFDGEALHDLNDLIDPNNPDWTIHRATDITDLGQILASAIGPDGMSTTVLLTPDHLPAPIAPTALPEYAAPVPEPSTLLVLATGLGLARRHARARGRR